MIHVHSRHTPAAKLDKKYPGAVTIDVTSRGPDPWVRFSPFYPHGDLPVPGRKEHGQSVEGIWQGLKVFDGHDVDRDHAAPDDDEQLSRRSSLENEVELPSELLRKGTGSGSSTRESTATTHQVGKREHAGKVTRSIATYG